MQPTDDALVRAVLEGDRSAFVALYDRYAPLIRAIAWETTSNLNEAQDLSQEVFLRAYQRLGELRSPDQFGAWLVSFARRIGLEWYRGRRRERRDSHDAAAEADRYQSTSEPSDVLESLRLAIATLSEKERLAIHLFYLQEQPAEQARSMLGLSRSGFYRLLERARGRLESILRCEQETNR